MPRRRQTPISDGQSGPSCSLKHQKSSDHWWVPLLWLFPATCTLACSYDNFQERRLLDVSKAYQEWLTGIAQVVICLFFLAVKVYEEFLKDPLIKFPTCRANVRIYRDTAVMVIISYVLLLDINLSYLWLSMFPAIAIIFIYALCIKLCPPGEEGDKLAGSSNGGHHDATIPGHKKALQAMAEAPFLALLVLAQLDDSTADRFAISQFLLFLSTTVGALTYMMMRLPTTGTSPGVASASELLHKAFLLLVLVTVHTVAAEALGEDVVLFCILEVGPMLLWLIVHLDRESPIISIDKVKPQKNFVIASSAGVVAALCLGTRTSMDEFGLSICTAIMKTCGVSGILTYYVVFMLHQWPPGKQSVVSKKVGTNISIRDAPLQSENQAGKDKGATPTSAVDFQSEERAGSPEVVQLLMLWANALLVAAAALLLLKYAVPRRLGQKEALFFLTL